MARKTVEPEVKMQRIHEDSLPNRLAALELHECLSESVYLDMDFTTKEELTATAEAMRNRLNLASYRAAKRSGFKFELCSNVNFAKQQNLLVTVTVIRVE